MSTLPQARTYNQSHIPRVCEGQAALSYLLDMELPVGAQRDPRRWKTASPPSPRCATRSGPPTKHPSTARRFLRALPARGAVSRSALSFRDRRRVTGHPVAVFQRRSGGVPTPHRQRILADTDTLMVFGLDTSWPSRRPPRTKSRDQGGSARGTCLCRTPPRRRFPPTNQRQVEYQHHGDPLVPRQQRFDQYTRSSCSARRPRHQQVRAPARGEEGHEKNRAADHVGLGRARPAPNVTTFNHHPHLPHYQLTAGESKAVQVLPTGHRSRPAASLHYGRRLEFTTLLWMPPRAPRTGHITRGLTNSTLFGGRTASPTSGATSRS